MYDNDISEKSLDERIRELELKKLDVKQKIEDVLAEISDKSGVKSLKKRKYAVGFAPNDWKDE